MIPKNHYLGTFLRRFFSGSQLSHASSSQRWKGRQGSDWFVREAKNRQYRSRAAFKLCEIQKKYSIFKPNQTVVDLGFAPGSWSQVAYENTQPGGKVIGVDILYHAPPRGCSAIQGNFLSRSVQDELKAILSDPEWMRPKHDQENTLLDAAETIDATTTLEPSQVEPSNVDVILSDMLVPYFQTRGFNSRSISDPYLRLSNTSGIAVRDHSMSIDLCDAALMFALDTLKPNGSFVCKFYSGSEDKLLEQRLRKVFKTVKRDKPSASRSESKEAYFVCLGKKANASKESVFGLKPKL